MLTKEEQDKIWSDLSPESKKILLKFRDHTLKNNQDSKENQDYAQTVNNTLSMVFGQDNIIKEMPVKTWSDVVNKYHYIDTGVDLQFIKKNEHIAYKMQATFKIATLINIAYGGIVSEKEWQNEKLFKYVVYYKPIDKRKFICAEYVYGEKHFVAFKTRAYRDEFMSYSENIKLLEDYFQIF